MFIQCFLEIKFADMWLISLEQVIYVTQHSKIRNKSGLSNLANQLQSARMGIFGWKGRFSDIGEFS